MTLPKHTSPDLDNHSDKIASAPYNFIPLPDTVVRAVESPDQLPEHHKLLDSLHSGHIDVEIETMSPLYIRSAEPAKSFRQGPDSVNPDSTFNDDDFRSKSKNRPEFFHRGDPNQPIIPGSSLRGMLRSVVEIACHGKMTRITDQQQFFRSMDMSSLQTHYVGRMKGNVRCGFLQNRREGFVIVPTSGYRVPHTELRDNDLYKGKGANRIPRWNRSNSLGQNARVYFLENNGTVSKIRSATGQRPGGYKYGMLVLSGAMGTRGKITAKQHDYVFEINNTEGGVIPVPDEMVDRFNDDDQITKWQQDAYPIDRPSPESRKKKGALVTYPKDPGDPVFYLMEEKEGKEKLTFFGRTRMFRLPYEKSPRDLVPEKTHRSPEIIDFAEALFGYVRDSDEIKKLEFAPQGSAARAYAGRLSVGDAVVLPGQTHLHLEPVVPHILSSPRPTAFQHYLTQNPDYNSKNWSKELLHYDSHPDDVTIRGFKRYWPQGERRPDQFAETNIKPRSSQHTYIRPIRAGVRFRFRVHFESLNSAELGALCWAIQPIGKEGRDYVHMLGMGKPLGLGAVKVRRVDLNCADLSSRYRTLFSSDSWAAPSRDISIDDVRNSFEKKILESTGGAASTLADVPRVAYLLKMMEWDGAPAARPEPAGMYLDDEYRPNTRYMNLDEYKHRFVLPDPRAFDGHLPDAARTIKQVNVGDKLQNVSKNTSGILAKVVGFERNMLLVKLHIVGYEDLVFKVGGTNGPEFVDEGSWITVDVADWNKKKKRINNVTNPRRTDL